MQRLVMLLLALCLALPLAARAEGEGAVWEQILDLSHHLYAYARLHLDAEGGGRFHLALDLNRPDGRIFGFRFGPEDVFPAADTVFIALHPEGAEDTTGLSFRLMLGHGGALAALPAQPVLVGLYLSAEEGGEPVAIPLELDRVEGGASVLDGTAAVRRALGGE